MLDVLRWYVVVQLLGVAALPIAARFFGGLPDRGYAFARPLGLLLVGVLLWFGALFGVWTNTGATVALLLVAVAVVGWLGMPASSGAVRALWRERRSHLLVVEALFLGTFVFWAFCRSFFPEIQATEKPMDFMLLNGILRSQRFPPVDPWLAGYSISYYYLGYLLIAVLTELSGVAPAVAFNLAVAVLFALTASGAFAVAHALVDGSRRNRALLAGGTVEKLANWPSWLAGLLGAVFVVFTGNLEGLLEILQAHGFGSAAFWRWLSIWNLNHPYVSSTWYPNDAQDSWWWFRASRVITDYPFGGQLPRNYNTINEFPFFSFLLGDLHPHLLALPFAFVCLGYALSFVRSTGELRLTRLASWGWDFAFIAFLFGALFLLNAWDILTYLFVLLCAYAVRLYLARPAFDLRWLRQSALFGVAALAAGVGLYWPFYLTFSSQASGLLGIVDLHSHLRQFLIFWGLFLFLAGSLLVAELVCGVSPLPGALNRRAGPAWTRSPLVWAVVGVVATGCFVAHAPALTVVIPMLVASLALVCRYLAGAAWLNALPSGAWSSVRPERQAGSAARPGRASGPPAEVAGGAVPASWAAEHVFVLVLLFVAMLLLLGTELVYIQDLFHDRMNTVFKLYYQAWQMLALVGAYTVFSLGSRLGLDAASGVGAGQVAGRQTTTPRLAGSDGRPAVSPSRWVTATWLTIVAVVFLAAFVYVPAAIESRTNGFTRTPTLNGLAYYAREQPDDSAAIAWLRHNVAGTPTILEATGGSYSADGNVAWMTGLPTVLGWNFHEVQWHGPAIESVVNQRKAAIETIYRTTDSNVARELLSRYGVTYVYVGPMEREAFPNDPAGLAKFRRFMDVVYQNSGVTIYRVRGGG